MADTDSLFHFPSLFEIPKFGFVKGENAFASVARPRSAGIDGDRDDIAGGNQNQLQLRSIGFRGFYRWQQRVGEKMAEKEAIDGGERVMM